MTQSNRLIDQLRGCAATFAAALAIGASGLVSPSVAPAADLTITTGGETGTYIQFGNDIANLASQVADVTVDVAQSQGSVENLKRLLGYDIGSDQANPDFYQLAIIQDDVLSDLRRHASTNEVLADIVSRVKVVMPLYNEEVHLYVRPDAAYENFEDFGEAVIAAGKPGSGSFITTNLLIALAGGISPELDQNSAAGALELVRDEFLDVAVHVAGAPSKLGLDEAPANGLALAEITAPAIFADGSPYVAVEISPEQYPWLDRPVRTAAVGSILVAYDYPDGSQACENITKVTKAIVDNIEVLRANGHPKWGQVDPNAAFSRTDDLSPCAERAFNQ